MREFIVLALMVLLGLLIGGGISPSTSDQAVHFSHYHRGKIPALANDSVLEKTRASPPIQHPRVQQTRPLTQPKARKDATQ